MPTDEKLTAKAAATVVADTDLTYLVQDVSTTPVSKKLAWSLIKSTLKTYFDTLYQALVGALGTDLWVTSSATWTYVSATTFTVPTDLTAVFKVGTRIKLTQTTDKFFYVASSAYGAPNTTVTVTGGADFTIANAAITAAYYSYGNPPDFPYWFNHTPGTRTGYSLAAGTEVIRFAMDSSKVILAANLTAVTSTATTFAASLPLTAKTVTNQNWGGANGYATDNGAALTTATRWVITSAGTDITFYKDMASAAWTGSSTKGVRVVAMYEAA